LRRTRTLVALAAALFAGLFAVATYLWLSGKEARRQAETNAQQAEQERQKTQKALTALQEESGRTQSAQERAENQSILASQNAREAVQQRNQALGRQLASDSVLVRNSNADGTVAALLGIESLQRAETVQGYEALWGAGVRMAREVSRLAHQGIVAAVAFSPDGTLVATGSWDNTARVFEARTGREVSRLAHQSVVNAVAFSPDGTLVATGSWDNTARVFEARTGCEVSRLAHQSVVSAVAFSPDGTLVATHSGDNTARVFEARTGREVARLALGELVQRVDFVSGGRFLRAVSGETDLHITQDPIQVPDLIAQACSKLDRNLTREEWTTYLFGLPYRETCRQLNPAASGKQK
jgi:roadblock/LC7 domain-containing protein